MAKYLIVKRADLNGKSVFPGDIIADPYGESILIARGFIVPAANNARVTVDIWEDVPREPVPTEAPTGPEAEPVPVPTEEQAPSAAPSAEEPAPDAPVDEQTEVEGPEASETS